MNETGRVPGTSPVPIALEITPEQGEQLQDALALMKAFAAPSRLTLLGALASGTAGATMVDRLVKTTALPAAVVERDLQQLIGVGLVVVEEWNTARPGADPVALSVAFNPAFTTRAPQAVAAISRLVNQFQPPARRPSGDPRAQTLNRFMQDGRLLDFPLQPKRQQFVLEEVAKAFDPGRDYTEREVDGILKEIYAYDHCTLRRALVDFGFLQRDHGIYAKVESTAEV